MIFLVWNLDSVSTQVGSCNVQVYTSLSPLIRGFNFRYFTILLLIFPSEVPIAPVTHTEIWGLTDK